MRASSSAALTRNFAARHLNLSRRALRTIAPGRRRVDKSTVSDPINLVDRVATTGSQTSNSIPGKATTEGTEQFILNSGLHLFHKFNISQLYINPVIHGAPRLPPIRFRKPINKNLADKQLLTAVCRNCSNMVYVYNHYSNTHVAGYWNSTIMHHMFLKETIKGTPNPHYRPREGIVTVAGLGLAAGYDETLRRLREACETTGLENIDFAVIECNDATFEATNGGTSNDELADSLIALEVLCKEGVLQSYGVNIAIKPFTYHTPPIRHSSGLMMLPALMESSITDGELLFADLIIYPICPTHAQPHTYPMLDSDPEIFDVSKEGGSDEMSRKYTRAAQDPLLCFSGGTFVDEDAPGLTISEALETGPDRVRGRSDNDELYLDPLEDPEVHSLVRIQEIREKKIDSEIDYATRQNKNLSEENILALVHEKLRFEEESKPKDIRNRKKKISNEVRRLSEMSRVPDLILLSGLSHPETEEYFGKELDDHCVLLESTPKLQDKAMRIVLSVGCEVVIIDSELSACLRKLTLNPLDLLTADETNDIFGNFGIQRDDNENDGDEDR